MTSNCVTTEYSQTMWAVMLKPEQWLLCWYWSKKTTDIRWDEDNVQPWIYDKDCGFECEGCVARVNAFARVAIWRNIIGPSLQGSPYDELSSDKVQQLFFWRPPTQALILILIFWKCQLTPNPGLMIKVKFHKYQFPGNLTLENAPVSFSVPWMLTVSQEFFTFYSMLSQFDCFALWLRHSQ